MNSKLNNISIIAIENTTLCGADCIMCPRDEFHYHNETIDFELFKRCVDESVELGVKFFNLTGFGDSLLDKNFENEVKYIKNKYPDVRIGTTNTCQLLYGHLLDILCEYVDEIQISMYGITKDTYHKIHRGSLVFEKIKNNIDQLLEREKKPYCLLEFLVMPENENELEEWLKYYEPKADRVDVWKLQNWAGYIKNESLGKPFQKCFRISTLNGLYIRTDGSVSMCCIDYDRNLVIGNLNEKPLKEIINGEVVKVMRQMNEDGSIFNYSICKNCDQLHDRSDALIYSSDKNMRVGKHSMLIEERVYED